MLPFFAENASSLTLLSLQELLLSVLLLSMKLLLDTTSITGHYCYCCYYCFIIADHRHCHRVIVYAIIIIIIVIIIIIIVAAFITIAVTVLPSSFATAAIVNAPRANKKVTRPHGLP